VLYGFRICSAALIAWSLSCFDQSLFSYTVPALMRDLRLSLADIANILSVGFLLALLVTLGAGIIADRFGRRISLVLFLSLSAVCVGTTGFARSGFTLGILRALGFSLGNGLSPITSSYVAEGSPPRYRGLLISVLQCGYPIGWFAASFVAVPLLATYGWRALYYCAFFVPAVAILLYLMLPESRSFQEAAARAEVTSAWARIRLLCQSRLRRRTFLGALVYLLFGGAYGGSAFYFPTFFHVVRGYGESTSARIVGAGYGIGILGYLGAAVIGEFVTTRRNTAAAWCVLGTIALLALIWLPRTYHQDVVAFGIVAVFFYGVAGVLQTFITELFPTHLRATGAALSASSGLCIGFAVFPIVVARCVGTVGWQWGFTATVVPALFLAGLVICGLDNIPSGQALATDVEWPDDSKKQDGRHVMREAETDGPT
jgi:MFS family permease